MSDERTEDPTPRRRQEARKKGQVAKSAEVSSAAGLLATFVVLGNIGPRLAESIMQMMQRNFSSLAVEDLTVNSLNSGGIGVVPMVFQAVAPLALAAMVAGVISNVAQVGFMFSEDALKPDVKRLNPLNGFKRIFSMQGGVELAKSIAKLLIIGYVVYSDLQANTDAIAATGQMALPAAIGELARIALGTGTRAAGAMLVIAAVDYFYQRQQHNKNLKMTKQEVIEEMKQNENTQVKAKIRQRQRQIAMNRMMADVPTADVVITNPTHIAIALRYDKTKSAAPIVVAKGERLVAQRIKEIAKKHNIPTVENKPLARLMLKTTEVGREIPVEVYQAVAEVLAFVYRLKNRRVRY